MPNYQYVNDPTPNDGIDYTYVISGYQNYDGIILGPGVNVHFDNGWLDGNDLPGSIGLLSQSDNFQVTGVGSITNFDTGIFSGGQYSAIGGSYEGALQISANNLGAGVSGHSSIYNTNAAVGNFDIETAFGFVGWGGSNYFAHDNVTSVYAGLEAVGFSMGYGGTAVDVTAVGGGGGWSFGYWVGGGGPVYIGDSSFTNFDVAIGNVSSVTLQNTVAEGMVDSIINQDTFSFYDYGGNTLSTETPDSSAVIYGTTGIDHLQGDASDQTIVGMGGNDVLFGGAGTDTFVFSPNVMSVAPDWVSGTDKIYMAYDTSHVWSFNPTDHILSVNGDEYAYLPGTSTVLSTDLFW